MTSSPKSLRLGRFRTVARDILMRDREARRLRLAVDTSGAIARALERAYQDGRKDAEAGPAEMPAPQPRALQWAEIPRRAADLLEAALPSSEYDRATRTATLDLARETGLFLAVGTGPNARYRVARAGPRWKGQVYLQEGTYSPRFFQTLLRMDLVAAGALPDGQRTLVPTSMAISAFIEETERLASTAGYRFKLIPPP